MDVPRRRRSPDEPTAVTTPGWVTTVIRPAGHLPGADLSPVLTLLDAAVATGGAVLVDLRAAERLPDPLLQALVDADQRLAAAGGVLLVLDPDSRHGLPVQLIRDTGALDLAAPAVHG